MKRAVVFLALPLPLILGGCAIGAAEASSGKTQTIAEQCASAEAKVATGNLAGQISNEAFGCGVFHLGEGMSGLRNATTKWDDECLSGHGWRLGGDGQPVAATDKADSWSGINSCASLALTDEECRAIGDALSGGSRVYRSSEAASLSALGCSSKAGTASTVATSSE